MPDPADSLDLSTLSMSDEARQPRRRRRRSRWRTPLILVGALIVAGVLAWRLPLPFFLPRVATATAQVLTPVQARTVLTATGYTYARERAAVGAKIVGRVVRLGVDEGDSVKAGQMIAVLDSDDARAAVAVARGHLAEAQAELADAERDEARKRGLLDKGLLAQADYDPALARLERAQAAVESANGEVASAGAQAAYTTISAPIDGVVIERNVEVGEMVAPGGFTSQQGTGAIVRIANLESLEVEADINESYIAQVEIGQPGIIKVDAVPDRQYHGRLRQVVPTADRQRGTVQVKVTIEDRDEHLVPDMSSSVSFLEPGTRPEDLSGPSQVLVPESALLTKDGNTAVFVVEKGRLHRTEVTTGARTDGQVTIVSGLKGGETVARDGVEKLRDGARVRTVAP
jgi:RND family efflux transporter MFP subunit